jgi:hypothetical protein
VTISFDTFDFSSKSDENLNLIIDYIKMNNLIKHILLEINNTCFFINENNVKKFNFVKNISLGYNDDLMKNNINFKLFANAENIVFANNFKNTIEVIKNFPIQLRNLQLHHKFNSTIDYMIPNLNTLITGDSFNSNILIPESKLIEIRFGHSFNKDISNLPETLEIIIFGYSFNNDVSNLPIGIKKVHFGNKFNKSVDYLPNSIEEIIFGTEFNQDLSNLPNSLIKIEIKNSSYPNTQCAFKYNIDCLPNSVLVIKLLNNKYNKIIHKLPNKLEKIELLTEYAYSTNKETKNTNTFDIKNIIKKQNLNCEIKLH